MSGRVQVVRRGGEPGRAPAPPRRLGRGPRRGAPRRARSSASSRGATCCGRSARRSRSRPSRPTRSPTSSAGCERLAPVFDAVAAASDTVDGVYLVGGTVRDILLGEASFDVDIAVEGDAIAFARCARRVSSAAASAPHEKFGTAVVLYGDEQHVDVVTARTEFYDAPAALPTVEHAAIRDDLHRRDFTINAMAASLKGDDFGRLVDPFGGRARPRRRADPRPPQPLVHRRPDPDLPRHSLREPATASASTSTPRDSRAGASRWGSSATCPRHACATSSRRCSRRARSSTPCCGSPSSARPRRSIRTCRPTRRPSA